MLNDTAAADEWEAAMAEQAAAPSAAATAAPVPPANAAAARPAPIFNPLTAGAGSGTPGDIDLIMDIPVQLTVELGRTRIPIRHILQLAQGEVVVVNDKFGIRLTDIVTPAERMRKLSR
jgi:flagellar motor switch protein FliN/FliY